MANKSFEEKLSKIEGIIADLESNELPLDESVELFNKGITLSRQCEKQLNEAQLKVEKIYGDEQ